MAYFMKIHLKDYQDRRRKLTDAQKEEIRLKYNCDNFTISQLSQLYGLCKSAIFYIINPYGKNKCSQYSKKHWRKYQQSKEEQHRQYIKLRDYKKELYERGELQ